MDGIVFRATVTSFLQWKIADFKNEAILGFFKYPICMERSLVCIAE